MMKAKARLEIVQKAIADGRNRLEEAPEAEERARIRVELGKWREEAKALEREVAE